MGRQVSEVRSGVVRILDVEGAFLGSGIAVAHDLVVTCAHVVAGEALVLLDVHQGSPDAVAPRMLPEARVLATGAPDPQPGVMRHEDVAILRTVGGVRLTPLPMLVDLTPARLGRHARRLSTRGFSSAHGVCSGALGLTLRGALWTTAKGHVRSGQVDGGVPHGLSGAPLLVRHGDAWLVAGMFYLGGEAAGQSVFYGADVLLDALAACGCAPAEPRSAANEPLHPRQERLAKHWRQLLFAGLFAAVPLCTLAALRARSELPRHVTPSRALAARPAAASETDAQSSWRSARPSRDSVPQLADAAVSPLAHGADAGEPKREHAGRFVASRAVPPIPSKRNRRDVRSAPQQDASVSDEVQDDYDPLADPRRR